MQAFVHQERLQTLDTLQQQRIATIAAFHAERLGTFAELHAERLGATADLRGERQAILSALRDDELAALNNLRATSEKEIQILHAQTRDLIDRLFLRALELMLLTVLLCSLVAWILLRRFTTEPRGHDERLAIPRPSHTARGSAA